MMWGLTPKKVVDRINAIIDELGQYELRIRAYEDHFRLTSRLMPDLLHQTHEVAEWRMAHDDIYESLVDARAGIQAGVVDHRVIAKQLPAVKKAVRNFKRVLDRTDAASASGRKAAQKAFGINASD